MIFWILRHWSGGVPAAAAEAAAALQETPEKELLKKVQQEIHHMADGTPLANHYADMWHHHGINPDAVDTNLVRESMYNRPVSLAKVNHGHHPKQEAAEEAAAAPPAAAADAAAEQPAPKDPVAAAADAAAAAVPAGVTPAHNCTCSSVMQCLVVIHGAGHGKCAGCATICAKLCHAHHDRYIDFCCDVLKTPPAHLHLGIRGTPQPRLQPRKSCRPQLQPPMLHRNDNNCRLNQVWQVESLEGHFVMINVLIACIR